MEYSEWKRLRPGALQPPAKPVPHAHILNELGKSLKLVYVPLVEEKLPEHLAHIVEKLERPPAVSRH